MQKRKSNGQTLSRLKGDIHDIMVGREGFHTHDGVTFEVLTVRGSGHGTLVVRLASEPPPKHPLHGVPVDSTLWISHCCVGRNSDCTVVVGERSELQIRLWKYLNREVRKLEKAERANRPEHHATRFTQDLGSIASLDTIFGRVEPEEEADGALDPA